MYNSTETAVFYCETVWNKEMMQPKKTLTQFILDVKMCSDLQITKSLPSGLNHISITSILNSA